MSETDWREPLETLLELFREYGCDRERDIVQSALGSESEDEACTRVATGAFWGGMGSLLDVSLASLAKDRSHRQICDDEIGQALAFWSLAGWLEKKRGRGLWSSRMKLMEDVVGYWRGRRDGAG